MDDCLIFTPNKEETDALITEMDKDILMTNDGLVEQYLGVKVEIKRCFSERVSVLFDSKNN